MNWKIYYTNGDTFSSDDGAPWEAPHTQVQVVQQKDEKIRPKRKLYAGSATEEFDYYCWHPDPLGDPWKEGEWIPHNAIGLLTYLQETNPFRVVLFGYWIPEDQYKKIFSKAFNDKDFKTLQADLVPENLNGR